MRAIRLVQTLRHALRFLRTAGLTGGALLIHGCGMLHLPPPIHWATASTPEVFRFPDGGDALFYTLDKRLEPRAPADPDAQPSLRDTPVSTFVFFISGSGCTSLRYFLPQYFRGLEGESGSIRIFMLQKRFIAANGWGRSFGCSRAFSDADHPSRWLADQSAFISAQRAAAAATGWQPIRIVIAGVSEGAEIAPLLARSTPGVTHVVLLGNGGMPPIEAYRLQLARHGLAMPTGLFERDGTASALVAGHSHRYWSEIAQLDPARDLLSISTPVWVAMGEQDEAVPIASARYLAEQFAAHGRTDLVLKIYAGADHALSTNSRTNTADFWFLFDRSMAR